MRIILLLLIIVSPLSHALNSLKAQLDRDSPLAGETFVLTITADDSINNKLDTSHLLKQFIVGQTNISRSTQVINGQVRRQSTWTIGLIARKPGQYTIEPFTIDGISSEIIQLSVVKATSSEQKNADIMLKTELSNDSAYVGQQLIYTLKLYVGASLQRAELQPPELASAEISQIGEDLESNELVTDRRYRVITRRYAIRPTEAGDLELQGSVFRGDIQIGQRGFLGGGRSKPVTILADNHQINVNAIPDDFPGPWFVSDLVVLEQTWSTPKIFRVGEPITQTLTLTATNITQEQLPEIDVNFGVGFQVYPDKATSSQALNGDVMIAQSVHKIAIIPTQAGNMVLPAIKVPWFNTTTDKVEWAQIDEQRINVIAAIAKPNQPVVPIEQKNSKQGEITARPPPQQKIFVESATLIYWQLACVILLVTSIILALWLRKARQLLMAQEQPTETLTNDQYWDVLKKALTDNNHREIIRIMPLWLTNQFAMSPEQLLLTAPSLYDAYQQLIANNYGKVISETNCEELLSLTTEFKRQQQLPDHVRDTLYPDV